MGGRVIDFVRGLQHVAMLSEPTAQWSHLYRTIKTRCSSPLILQTILGKRRGRFDDGLVGLVNRSGLRRSELV